MPEDTLKVFGARSSSGIQRITIVESQDISKQIVRSASGTKAQGGQLLFKSMRLLLYVDA